MEMYISESTKIDWNVAKESIYISMSGDVYEGTFKDGIYHGKGIYIFKNGDKHEGEWIYGKRNGKFKRTLLNGN